MFAVSTRTRYGLRALHYLSEHNEKKPVSLNHIAEELAIPFKYLENIFKLLSRSGIVRGERGPLGGYTLARAADGLTLYEIADALDGPLVTVACVTDSTTCDKSKACPTRRIWDDLQMHINNFLKSRTLAMLLNNSNAEVSA
ncbi:MAG: Rrf2 family transcriptional regulator [Spirochaetales bacterium]|nr:Rrf2 family transcriptional regulator [Spirochaetales bacterium]